MGFQPWQYIAARLDPRFLETADDLVRDDDELVGIAVENFQRQLQYASDRLRSNKSTLLRALTKDPAAIYSASEEMQDDRDVILSAVTIEPLYPYEWMFCVLGERYNPEFLGGLSCASERLRDDHDVVMASVKTNGYSLKFASDRLRDNEDIVMAALKSSSYGAIKVASERFRSNRDLVREAVLAGSIKYVSTSMLTKELVEIGLNKSPAIFSDLPSKWRQSDDLLKIALQFDGKYLEFATDKQKADFDLVMMAIESNPLALKFASPKIKNKDKLLEAAVLRGLLLPEKYFSNERLAHINLQNIKRSQDHSDQKPTLVYDDWYAGDWLKKIIKHHSSSLEIAKAAMNCKGPKPQTDYFVLFDDELRASVEFCSAAIAAECYVYNLLSDDLKANRDLALSYVESSSSPDLKKLPEALASDVEIVKKCLQKWPYNVDYLSPQFVDLPEAFRAKVLKSFDGSNLSDQEIEKLSADLDLLNEAAEKVPRIFMLRKGLQSNRDALLKAAGRARSDYGSRILDELASDYEVLERLEFIPENIPPAILSDREFIKKRVLGPHGFNGLDTEIQSDEELINLYLKEGSRDISRRYDDLPAHIKKRESIVLLAISVGAISWLHMIPEKLQNDDRILNAFYDWLQKNPAS